VIGYIRAGTLRALAVASEKCTKILNIIDRRECYIWLVCAGQAERRAKEAR
jgi:hypothetical protein